MHFFNNFPSPSLVFFRLSRIAYALLSPIRNLLSNRNLEVFNVVSIACGTASEITTFELLARSRGVTINYFGYDINKTDLHFNTRVLQKKAPNIRQIYIHSDVAQDPPTAGIANADCIIWRHPEFLSDHINTPKKLILDMCQILWNILENKNRDAPILITCYDPQEMMLIIELIQQFCEEDLKYNLEIDRQQGRASWQNPIIAPKDQDPIFNLNHHDQCQLLITQCQPKKLSGNNDVFLRALSKAFRTILPKIETCEQQKLFILLKNLGKADLDVLREATSYLNNQIRKNDNPFIKREQLISLLTQFYCQPEISRQLQLR